MTFAVNYVGAPFNTPLEENRLFAASVRWSAALYVALVIDIPRGEWCAANCSGHCNEPLDLQMMADQAWHATHAGTPLHRCNSTRPLVRGSRFRCASPGLAGPPGSHWSHPPPHIACTCTPLSLAVLPSSTAGLASWFSLVPIPGDMQLQMLLLAGGAFAAATAIERGARAAFPAPLPPEKGGLVGRGRGSRAALRSKED